MNGTAIMDRPSVIAEDQMFAALVDSFYGPDAGPERRPQAEVTAGIGTVALQGTSPEAASALTEDEIDAFVAQLDALGDVDDDLATYNTDAMFSDSDRAFLREARIDPRAMDADELKIVAANEEKFRVASQIEIARRHHHERQMRLLLDEEDRQRNKIAA